jgi:MFS family permease
MSHGRRNNILGESPLRSLTHDARLLFLTRFTRLFAYGALSVVLVFYLTGLGLSEPQTGLLFTLTLAGDIVVSLFLTTAADRIGRRRMLVVGSLLMAGAGLAFARAAARPLEQRRTSGGKSCDRCQAGGFGIPRFSARRRHFPPPVDTR